MSTHHQKVHRKELAFIWLCWLMLIAGAVLGYLWVEARGGDIYENIFGAIALGVIFLVLTWIGMGLFHFAQKLGHHDQ